VSIAVFEQPDLNSTVYVSDDGTLPVALAGPVHVAGLTPAAAGQAIATALRDGKFLVDPHVTVTVVNAFTQRVSVLGEVAQPGRYTIDSRTTFLDLLAQAGGKKESGADVAYLLHNNPGGTTSRESVDLDALQGGRGVQREPEVRGGDVIVVPKAEHYFVYGEVAKTGEYRLYHDLTVLQAIVQAGGITAKGSMNRIVITREGPDGKGATRGAKLSDLVHPGDEIRVKESIF
jgi:polysaccharide export outer membrane protein